MIRPCRQTLQIWSGSRTRCRRRNGLADEVFWSVYSITTAYSRQRIDDRSQATSKSEATRIHLDLIERGIQR